MDAPLSALRHLPTRVAKPIRRLSYQTSGLGRAAVLRSAVRLWHFALNPRLAYPNDRQEQAMLQHLRQLFAQDLRNAEHGYYPQELLDTPISWEIFAKSARLLPDSIRILIRRVRQHYDDLPASVVTSHYPPYYVRNFHWQTDGWFSQHSAELYDSTVELLFSGTADIMRRMTIPPLVSALKAAKRPRILDVACGTGRYLGQLQRAMPEAKLYGLDLSPHYIQFAQQSLQAQPGISFVHDNAEKLPFANNYFDASVSIYLFHEMPLGARRNVLAEMARVTKPGGTIVLCDSAQAHDVSDSIGYFENFPHYYHEPYYKSYFERPLEDLAAEAGIGVKRSERWYISKVVVGSAATLTAKPTN